MTIHCQSFSSLSGNLSLCGRPQYLLGDLEAHEGAEPQHLLHLFRGGGDEGDVLAVLVLLQLTETCHKPTLVRVLKTWGDDHTVLHCSCSF